MKKKILWLDDMRDPSNEFHWRWIPEITQETHEVIWVKNFNEFIDYIMNHEMPDIISFDHDIDEEHIQKFRECKKSLAQWELVFPNYDEFTVPTGYDAAKWLIDYVEYGLGKTEHKALPKWRVHSANIVGAENIKHLLLNYMKHKENEEH